VRTSQLTFLDLHRRDDTPNRALDYTFVNEDNVKRRGRTMIAIVGGKLYVMSLNATELHYFDAALPDFQTMAASATTS